MSRASDACACLAVPIALMTSGSLDRKPALAIDAAGPDRGIAGREPARAEGP